MEIKIKPIVLKRLAKKIELENEKFEKATKAEKRVIVAQDCIERINIQQIIPESGCFLDFDSINEMKTETTDKSFQKILNSSTINTTCQACAKGGLFMSFVGRVNKININDIECGNDLDDKEHKKLLQLFSQTQLALIEAAFEGAQYINAEISKYTDSSNKWSFSKYIDKYPNDKKRLIAICENIIENKGTFVY
jgi:hypothetical protein